MADGDLRKLFQRYLPEADIQSVESWSTGRGVPDMNYCLEGYEGWIECKSTSTWTVGMRAEQVGWIERRLRAGGKVYVAVRRKHEGGPMKGAPADQLWIYEGIEARALMNGGIKEAKASIFCIGGPAKWDWKAVRDLLTMQNSLSFPALSGVK